MASIASFTVTTWAGDQLEPATPQVGLIDPPAAKNGVAYAIGGYQANRGQVRTGQDTTDTTSEDAEALAQSYRDLKGTGVTVVNSVGRTIEDVMVFDVRCEVAFNSGSGFWRVTAFWTLDPPGVAP
jgi:hypothetical protein